MPTINGQERPLTLDSLVDYAADRALYFSEERKATEDEHLKVYLLGRQDAYEDIMQVWFEEHSTQENPNN